MKEVAAAINSFSQDDISAFEQNKVFELIIGDQSIQLETGDAEIMSEDIPGWQVASEGPVTVALDTTISEQLKEEGIAREIVNRIQNLRKDKGFKVTDKISIKIQAHEAINKSISNNLNYICTEILASSLEMVEKLSEKEGDLLEVGDEIKTITSINKLK